MWSFLNYLQRPFKEFGFKPGVLSNVKPILVTDIDTCIQQIDILRKCCHNRVLGLDCEWVNNGSSRRPVALLQLSAVDGYCLLIRLPYLDVIPMSLKLLLADPCILKVGVAIKEDSNLLIQDYDINVDGVVDLRFLTPLVGEDPRGLAFLSKKFLNDELEKNWRISASNWEAARLSEQQIMYAAKDAFASVKIFESIMVRLDICRKISWFGETKEYDWESVYGVCEKFINLRLSSKGLKSGERVKNSIVQGNKKKKLKMPMRKKPLYENCIMEANDGELLCTCSNQKAEWYIKKNLADVVNDNPLTIRLRFDPTGRAVGDSGKFYQVVHENICVVCGKTNSYMKKNVVPGEYRKLFPKSSSHDVLLLCISCHQKSNCKDQSMRMGLEKLCNAPINNRSRPKYFNDFNIQKVQSAAKALSLHSKLHQIPQEKQERMIETILTYYKTDTLTDELLENALNLQSSIMNPEYESHSKVVVEHYMKNEIDGILVLEESWRKFFLSSMEPSYMPKYWSVEHSRERLRIKFQDGRVNALHLESCGIKRDDF